jgi:hypothetical protein
MFEPDNFDELKELNNMQAEKQVLPGGEYAYEKEGFEDDDFSGAGEDENGWAEDNDVDSADMGVENDDFKDTG